MWKMDVPDRLYYITDYLSFSDSVKITEIPPDSTYIDLRSVCEIRRGTAQDPDHPEYCGTEILRRCCAPERYAYCVSFLGEDGSCLLDIEFLSKEDFNALLPHIIRFHQQIQTTLPDKPRKTSGFYYETTFSLKVG
jgi:hypothetical protein